MEANQPFEIRTSLDDENCLRVAVLGEIDLLARARTRSGCSPSAVAIGV